MERLFLPIKFNVSRTQLLDHVVVLLEQTTIPIWLVSHIYTKIGIPILNFICVIRINGLPEALHDLPSPLAGASPHRGLHVLKERRGVPTSVTWCMAYA